MEAPTLEVTRKTLQINRHVLSDKSKEEPFFTKNKKVIRDVTTMECTDYLYFGFRLIGLNVPPKYKIPFIIYSLAFNFTVNVFQSACFLMFFFQPAEDQAGQSIDNLLNSIQVCINVWGSATKFFIMVYLYPKLRKADPVLERMDIRCETEEEITELRKLAVLGRRIVIGFTMVYWSYSTSTFISSVFAGHPPYSLPFPYIHWRNSSFEFWIASVIEWLLMTSACFEQVFDDTYAVIFVCILRSHMKILLIRLRRLGADKNMTLDENMEELVLCIKDHKTLLELYNIVAPIISVTIFVQFTITAALIGLTLINILIFAKAFSSIVASCLYILAVVVEIVPLCYYSQSLINDSNRLAEELFHCQWADQGIQYGKMLACFMHHTQRSMELTAGKIFSINMNSFISIAKFSFSLYTFIKKMGIKDRLQQEG